LRSRKGDKKVVGGVDLALDEEEEEGGGEEK